MKPITHFSGPYIPEIEPSGPDVLYSDGSNVLYSDGTNVHYNE
jgi:hypothetical protein